MKSCFSINVFMPEVLMNYGNDIFKDLKKDITLTNHAKIRMREREIELEDINLYSICEIYFDGEKIKELGIYRQDKNNIILAYVSVNSKKIKTIVKTNKYTFSNCGQRKRFNETIPQSLYNLFNQPKEKHNRTKEINAEILNLSKLMKKELNNLMTNYENMSNIEILEKMEYYHQLWEKKIFLKNG